MVRHSRRIRAPLPAGLLSVALAAITMVVPAPVVAGAPSQPGDGSRSAAVAAARLVPAPEDARGDRERLWSIGCLAGDARTTPRDCVFGARDSDFTLALVGDSHLSHLFPGFERLAKQRGWRLVVYVKVNCPFLDIPIRNRVLDRDYPECATWNAKVLRRLKDDPPDLTFTLAFRGIQPIDPAQDTPAREGRAIGRQLAKVPGRRGIIVDTPYSYRDVAACLTKHLDHVERCAIPSWQVLSSGVRTRERAAAGVAGATYIDLTARICGGFPCRVVTNGIVMFRDKHHLTATYAETLSGALGRAADKALR